MEFPHLGGKPEFESCQIKKAAMATDVEFSKRLKEHSEVVRFAQEILGIMASSDIQHDARKGAETVDKIRSKVSKSKEGTHTSIHGEYT